MGGYAFYVWTSYGITVVVLVANWIVPLRRAGRLRTELMREAQRGDPTEFTGQ